MPDITSRQHPLVKIFKAAAGNDHERALLDGWHLLREAVDAGIAIETVLVAGRPTDDDAVLLDRVARDSQVLSVSTAVMDAASPVRTPAGVVALARRRSWTLPDLLSPQPALVVVAVDIQDPGNTGAIIRSAEAGAATGVVLAGASADAWNWKALRAAMGSTFRVPVLQQPDALAATASLRTAGIRLLATIPRHGPSMYDLNFRAPTALLLGGEGAGLSLDLIESADDWLSIPMAGPVESLNVAVAAGVLVYEAQRQRTGA